MILNGILTRLGFFLFLEVREWRSFYNPISIV